MTIIQKSSEEIFFHSHRIGPLDEKENAQLIKKISFTHLNDHLFVLIPNLNQVKIWYAQYEMIQNHFYPHRPSFSVNDYKLAYLGTETCTTIISNDHHLQNQLHQYLDFECILPGQVTRYPNFEMFLIDANLLIPILNSDQNAKMMAKMFINAKDKTFLIPNFILEEVLKFASGNTIKKTTTRSNEGQKWLISNRYRSIFEENYN